MTRLASVNRGLALWNNKHIYRPDEWTAEEEAGLADLDVPAVAQVRELLCAATQREHCRFWDSRTRTFSTFILASFVTLSQAVLVPGALRAAKHADAEGTWMQLETEFKLAVHLRESPLIVTLMDSRVTSRQAFESLPLALARVPIDPQHAERLMASLRRLQPETDVLRALDGERVLFAEPAWDSMVEGRFPSGICMDTDLANSLKIKALRPWRLLDEAKYFELLEAARARLAANPWLETPAQSVSDVFPITQEMCSGFSKLSGAWVLEEHHARDLAQIALRLALARAESGSYPNTLDALGDVPREPLTNQPYSYARVGAGYTLGIAAQPDSNWSIPR